MEFDAQRDARLLRACIEQQDVDAMFQLVCRRDEQQHELVEEAYKTMYDHDLTEALSQLGPPFQTTLALLLSTPAA